MQIKNLPKNMKLDNGKQSDWSIISFTSMSDYNKKYGYWTIQRDDERRYKITALLPWKKENIKKLWKYLIEVNNLIDTIRVDTSKENYNKINNEKNYTAAVAHKKFQNYSLTVRFIGYQHKHKNTHFERTVTGYLVEHKNKHKTKYFKIFFSNNGSFLLLRTYYLIGPHILEINSLPQLPVKKVNFFKKNGNLLAPTKTTMTIYSHKGLLKQVEKKIQEAQATKDSTRYLRYKEKDDEKTPTCFFIKLEDGILLKAYVDSKNNIVDKNGNKISTSSVIPEFSDVSLKFKDIK